MSEQIVPAKDMNEATRISGDYVHREWQGTPYRAFFPRPLPPVPAVRMNTELNRLLNDASEALGRLNGSILTLPNAPLFVYMYVRKEAVLSSQIEGTQSSLNDLLAAEADILSATRPRDVKEVVNYVQAMQTGLDLLPRLPVSVRLIRDIHRVLLQGVRGTDKAPGEMRRHPVWIGNPGASIATASFVPTPPDLVPEALAAWERFVHQVDDIPDLVRIGLAHAQFETIHPFGDGNGRVGRLLIALQLCERKRLDQPVLYLSHFFKANRQEYYDRLQATRSNGDWEGWLRFFLRGIIEVSADAAITAQRIVLLREAHRDLLLTELGRMAANGMKLLEALYHRPIVSAADVAEIAAVSGMTANTLLARFEALGLLAEITGQKRNRRFLYAPYTDLFDAGPLNTGGQTWN